MFFSAKLALPGLDTWRRLLSFDAILKIAYVQKINYVNPLLIGAGILMLWKANNKIKAVDNFKFAAGGLPRVSLSGATITLIFPVTVINNSIESFMVNAFDTDIYYGTASVGRCSLVAPVLINPKIKSGFEVGAEIYLTGAAIALVKAINDHTTKEKLQLRGSVNVGTILPVTLPVNITFDL